MATDAQFATTCSSHRAMIHLSTSRPLDLSTSPPLHLLRSMAVTDSTDLQSLTQAVQRYLDLMYDSDISQFERVFHATAQLHGLRDGKLSMITAQAFKDAIGSRPSLASRGVQREEQILLID